MSSRPPLVGQGSSSARRRLLRGRWRVAVAALAVLSLSAPGARADVTSTSEAATPVENGDVVSSAPNAPDRIVGGRRADVAPDDAGHWRFAGVPRLTLNSDEGIGLGVRGILYWHRFNTRPYKTAISFQAWATTRLVQHHFVRVDAIDAFNLPIRLEAETGFFSTLTLPFCGDPPVEPCVDDDNTRLRSMEPYVLANGRLRLLRQPWFKDTLKLEAFLGWRGTYYIPGTLFDDDGDGAPDLFPYPGSRYEAAHPAGEPGFTSVVQAGVALDTRDEEPNPTRGFFIDASVRSAQPAWGSTYSFSGANLTARFYVPVTRSRQVVFAERFIMDGVVGDAPWRERVRLGGLYEVMGIGGLDVGRGIRLARFAGRSRVSLQHELRVIPLTLDLWDNVVAFPIAFFLDTGTSFSVGEAPRLLVGGGVSVRVIWNRNFVMRLDLALSPEEPGRLSAYSAPGHPW